MCQFRKISLIISICFTAATLNEKTKTSALGKPSTAASHLRPRPCPPLGGAYGVVAGSPGLGPVLGAVFAVHRLVGAIVQHVHALHSSGLVAQLPAGLAAGTPLLHHPPEGTVTLFSGVDAMAMWRGVTVVSTYTGGLHSWTLQRLRMGFGFLLISQKLRCTRRLSLFLLHPYLVYCTPRMGHMRQGEFSLDQGLSAIDFM